MPRHPAVAHSVRSIRSAVYSSVAARLRSYQGEVYPFHVGDTWMEPAPGCRMEDLRVEDHPGMHRYTPPAGLPELRDALAAQTEERTGHATSRSEVLVAAGATAALSTLVGALLDPGDEVMIMAPYWPLIAGMVQAFRGEVVDVPFFAQPGEPAATIPRNADEAVEAFRRHLSPRTVALYLNTPHNPSGRVLPAEWSRAIVDWARSENLWVFSDEVYHPFVYRGEHASLRPFAPERTVAVHSFSKVYGMTGNRCGYLVGPADLLDEAKKIGTHTYYCAPRASQLAALNAVQSPRAAEWIDHARSEYDRLGRKAADLLAEPAPEGSTFFFLDVSPRLDERGLVGFLEDAADRGLLAAPGPSFGPYPHHIRVCFTCAEPEVVERGMGVLAELLGRG